MKLSRLKSGLAELWEAEVIQRKKTQSIAEYVLIFIMFIVGIISIGFMGKVKNTFQSHFTECVSEINN